ncbi:MAG TPA: hypothetical protein VGO61_17930 [Steroidobacteraceae bacterium]|jgi:hypothetical protein|nr:hypothetical protein [Steroidobacteraceae bacterium]
MDRDQMLWQLGVTLPALPPKLEDSHAPPGSRPSDPNNPEGNWTDDAAHTITRSGNGLWNNYDDHPDGLFPGPEAWRVGDYTPIDLLALRERKGGRGHGRAHMRRIDSPEEWWLLKRPEIKQNVETLMWGVIPKNTPKVTFTVVETTGGTGAGQTPYVQKAITGAIDTSGYPEVRNVPTLTGILRIPANHTGPVPVIVTFSNSPDAWLARVAPYGWGVLAYNSNTLQPDFAFANGTFDTGGTFLTSYLIGLVNKGNWRKPSDWGTLAAWSWGISRFIDYFETDPDVDATKIGVTGHSRYGKATLVAMAYEPRLAIGYPSCGGSLGTKMNRRHWGQDLENSAWDQEYHWMAGAFMNWMGELEPGRYLPRKIEKLPVDAHSLLSLVAPRPVFLNGGTQDSWTDPYGMFLTTVEASPVYELLGGKGMIMPDEKPQVNVAYSEGDLGFRYHDGGHTDALDAPAFLEFAKRYFDNHAPQISAGQKFTAYTQWPWARIGEVSVTDADNQPVGNWQITGGSGAWIFQVDRDTGELSVRRHADLDDRSYRLELSASDGITSAHGAVTIDVKGRKRRH